MLDTGSKCPPGFKDSQMKCVGIFQTQFSHDDQIQLKCMMWSNSKNCNPAERTVKKHRKNEKQGEELTRRHPSKSFSR